MPSRRRFLLSAALATGLAGCTGENSSVPDTTTDSTTGTTATTARTTSATTETTETTETPHPVEPRKETPESEAVQWRVSFDVPLAYRPAVADGRVFVPVGDPEYGSGETTVGALAALAAGNGAPRWTTELPAPPTGRPSADSSGVACTTGGADGLGLHGRNQRCLGVARDGTEEWRSKTIDQFLHLLALDDDRAYLATSDDALAATGQTLFAVGRSDGQTRWSVGSGDASEGRLLDGSLFVAPGWHAVARHDARTGERRWQKAATALGSADSRFTLADGALFVGTNPQEGDEEFAAIEISDGSQRWSYAEEGGESFDPTGAAVGENAMADDSTASGDSTVVGTEYDGRAFGLSVADGTKRWTFDLGGGVSSPVVGNGTAYVSGGPDDDPDVLYALDLATGTEEWRFSEETVSPHAVIDGGLLVTGAVGARQFVALLDPADGSERWRFSAIEELTTPVVTADGTVLVASERGIVRAIGE